MNALPDGTVTLLFSDIEGSTRLLEALGDGYADALARHREVVRAASRAAGGHEVDTQGDAFLVAFAEADAALAAAVAIQRGLAGIGPQGGGVLRVRIGLHTGTPRRTEEGYVGMDLHRGARVCAAGHGGQVVVSDATRAALAAPPPPGVTIRGLGAHRLRDIPDPMTLHDLAIDGLDDRFPAPRTIGARPTNLPPEPAELVGRDEAFAQLRGLLSAHRLVTLAGPGGVGKTALATGVAVAALAGHPDGAYLVPLATVAEARLVPSAIASSIGIREDGGRPAIDAVRDHLRDREMLLLLDNLEHVIAAAADVEALVAASPGLRVLATSRVPLRTAHERVMELPPLAVALPADAAAAPSAAVALFERRARAVQPGFRIGPDNHDDVAAICRGLDGLPLAIELAAARVRLMPPAVMRGRLARPLEIAGGGAPHADPRQRTLRSAIDWSVALLDDAARATFARLGVFAGPFTIDASEEVCGTGLDDLSALLDSSLVAAADDDGRLRLLETVRAVARERLEASGDAEEIRGRHAGRFAALARAGSPELLSGAHEELLPSFDAEQDDLRAAFDWLLASGRPAEALALGSDMAVFWDTRGQYAEGAERLVAALAATGDADPATRARALFGLGRMTTMLLDLERAEVALRESVALHRALGDLRSLVLCLSHLGGVRWRQPGGFDDAVDLATEALSVAREAGDPRSLALALNNLGVLLLDADPARARPLLEESAAIRRRIGERRLLAICLVNLGELAVVEGRIDDAEPLLRESLDLAHELGFDALVADIRINLARVAHARGAGRVAEALLLQAIEGSEAMGDLMRRAIALFGLARLAADQGDERARELRGAAEEALPDATSVLSPFERWDGPDPS